MFPLFLSVSVLAYLLIARLALRWLRGPTRDAAMAVINLAALVDVYYYCAPGMSPPKFLPYLFLVLLQYAALVMFAESVPWLAFFTPIGILIFFHYLPPDWFAPVAHLLGKSGLPNFVGLSYLAFRCSGLVWEVRNGSVKKPGIWAYLDFAFFLPTLAVGPINSYKNHRLGYADNPAETPIGRAVLRMLVGMVKYFFLGGLLQQLGYQPYLLNGRPHHWIDLPMVMVAYLLYLYCNFSGFCDMAIGAAAFIGIPVQENFNNPFAARNIKEFWNRWHITLSSWMRDIVFAPLSKKLVGVMGAGNANHAIALAIFVVFLLVGVWHGAGWNFLIYGASHAVGLVANHYYTIGLKKWLGREGFKAYMENRWIHAAAVALTFGYCAATLLFFANSLAQIGEIFSVLR